MSAPLTVRFWSKVDRRGPDECWPWLGSRVDGYGSINIGSGRTRRAHQVAFDLTNGAVPDGLELDHLCRNPWCVNPSHLEPVTHRENILRGEGPTARRARQTHCKRGHPLSGENLYVDDRGYRRCRECERNRERVRVPLRRAARRAARALS